MSVLLSADDLNDFISPGVACIKPVETLPVEDIQNPPVCAPLWRHPIPKAKVHRRILTKSLPKTDFPKPLHHLLRYL